MAILGDSLGDTAMKNQGLLLMAMSIRTANKYWKVYSGNNVYNNPNYLSSNQPYLANGVGILWSDKVDDGTWFNADLIARRYIQVIPCIPITELYIPAGWVNAMVTSGEMATMLTQGGGPDTGYMVGPQIMKAVVDSQSTAWTNVTGMTASQLDPPEGQSLTNMLYWVATRSFINNTPLTMAWIFPGDTNAVTEYSDSSKTIHVLKPEYLTVTTGGTLQELDDGNPATVGTGVVSGTNAGVNGYSASNLTSVKAHSQYQYCTISAAWTTSGQLHTLIASSTLQTQFINDVISWLNYTGMTGIELDWEQFTNSALTSGEYANYLTFMGNLATNLHGNGYKLMIDGIAIDGASGTTNPQSAYRFKYEDLASIADYLVPLIYDNEYNTSGAGDPQSSTTYITNCCNWCLSKVPDSTKIVAGLSAKGYYGTTGGYSLTDNQTLTQMQAKPGYPGTRDGSSQELIWASSGTSYDLVDHTALDSHWSTASATGVLHRSAWYIGSGVWF